MSHVRNLDLRVMTVVAALVGAIALLSDWARRGMWYGGGRRRNNDDDRGGSGLAGAVFFVIWIVAIMLAPLMAQLLAMMVSRRREYLADASGAELTRNPMGLARALEKIESAVGPTRTITRGAAHLCIADPIGRIVNEREGRWAEMFASHPPMAARIAALRQMAYEQGRHDDQRIAIVGTGLALAAGVWSSSTGSAAAARQAAATIMGFSPSAATRELAVERDLTALPSGAAAEADFDRMTAQPHHTGSPYQLELADYVGERFKTFGFDVSRYEYSVLIPWPGERIVEVVKPDPLRLQVEEDVLPDDPSASKAGALPPYNVYSPSGDVTGEVVYVNYGTPEDYETLAELGISVQARSRSHGTEAAGEASSRSSPPHTARSDASSTPTRETTDISRAMCFRTDPSADGGWCSAAASRIFPCIQATRRHPAARRKRVSSDCQLRRSRRCRGSRCSRFCTATASRS